MEKAKQNYEILDSGKAFFADLEDRIDVATDYVFIKQFLWRNDETGRGVASKLMEAMERGVKVFIVKDRIGAFHEYGEGRGQSFFHDEPQRESIFGAHSLRTVYFQARQLFSRFYGNGIEPQQKNPLRDDLVDHPNAKVMDQYKIYDHSKLVIVDGKVAYLGGIGFGNEFSGYGESDVWVDYMLKLNDEKKCDELLDLLKGDFDEDGGELRFLNDSALAQKGSSLHEYVLNFIASTRNELLIEMPFLGHPDYINAIKEVVGRGVKSLIVFPRRASSHHFRNLHFMKTLARQVGTVSRMPDNLDVFMTPGVLHGKALISDERMLFGSHNLHMDRSVLDEVVVETGVSHLIEGMRQRIERNAFSGNRFDDTVRWGDIFMPSRLEYLSIKFQTLMKSLRGVEVNRVRMEYRRFVEKMLFENRG